MSKCGDCAEWERSPVMRPGPVEEKACLKGYKLVRAETEADLVCFVPLTPAPDAASPQGQGRQR